MGRHERRIHAALTAKGYTVAEISYQPSRILLRAGILHPAGWTVRLAAAAHGVDDGEHAHQAHILTGQNTYDILARIVALPHAEGFTP